MSRLAVTLSALAFLWACAATAYLMLASSPSGMATAATLAAVGDGARRLPPPLATADGVWMAGLLIGVTIMAGMPLGIGLAHPPGLRATAWTAGLLLLGFCVLSGWPVGLLYLPSTMLRMVAGSAGAVRSRA